MRRRLGHSIRLQPSPSAANRRQVPAPTESVASQIHFPIRSEKPIAALRKNSPAGCQPARPCRSKKLSILRSRAPKPRRRAASITPASVSSLSCLPIGLQSAVPCPAMQAAAMAPADLLKVQIPDTAWRGRRRSPRPAALAPGPAHGVPRISPQRNLDPPLQPLRRAVPPAVGSAHRIIP